MPLLSSCPLLNVRRCRWFYQKKSGQVLVAKATNILCGILIQLSRWHLYTDSESSPIGKSNCPTHKTCRTNSTCRYRYDVARWYVSTRCKAYTCCGAGGCDRDCAGTGICLSVTCSAGAVYSECTTHRKESSAKQKYRKLSLSIDLAIFSRYGLTPIEIKRIFTHGLSLHFW